MIPARYDRAANLFERHPKIPTLPIIPFYAELVRMLGISNFCDSGGVPPLVRVLAHNPFSCVELVYWICFLLHWIILLLFLYFTRALCTLIASPLLFIPLHSVFPDQCGVRFIILVPTPDESVAEWLHTRGAFLLSQLPYAAPVSEHVKAGKNYRTRMLRKRVYVSCFRHHAKAAGISLIFIIRGVLFVRERDSIIRSLLLQREGIRFHFFCDGYAISVALLICLFEFAQNSTHFGVSRTKKLVDSRTDLTVGITLWEERYKLFQTSSSNRDELGVHNRTGNIGENPHDCSFEESVRGFELGIIVAVGVDHASDPSRTL